MEQMIVFNKPYTTGSEHRYIQEAIENLHLSGNGPFSRRCGDWLENATGAAGALLTHSATGALEMATLLADIRPGDEVVLPSFTFVSTANAVVLRGATPVFIDVREDTLNLDEEQLEAALTPLTKAVIPVHYAGVGCDMDTICEIAAARDLVVIEDAAQAICAFYRSRPLGGIGQLAALSFHETKNLMCGEGGALLVNDPALLERAEILQEKGTNRSKFFRGQVDKYTWVDVGSSFLLSEINAAFLWAQLEAAEEITQRRLAIWRRYHAAFESLEGDGVVRRPIVPTDCDHNAHIYYLLLEDGDSRDTLIAGLRESGIQAVFHYVPLHTSTGGRRHGRAVGELAVTSRVSERLVRLPLWAGMSDVDVDRVIAATEALLVRAPAGRR
jgi:dTDP-4-amino-4,6-dideoxygalactose transaminase